MDCAAQGRRVSHIHHGDRHHARHLGVHRRDPRSGFTSIPRSIYWAIVTLTTVGYGDISPQTVPGQALASMMMVCGYSCSLSRPASQPRSTAFRQHRAFTAAAATRVREASQSAGYSWQTRRSCPRVCTVCQEAGHDADAAFCKHCGSELNAHVMMLHVACCTRP